MSEQPDQQPEDIGATGHLDDEAEAAETSHEDGPAAAGEYDPAQGSPHGAHPVEETYPEA